MRRTRRIVIRTSFFAFLLFFLSTTAWALNINLVYFPNGNDAVDPCEGKFLIENGNIKLVPKFRACGAPGEVFHDRTPELEEIMKEAAAHWEDIFEDDHDLTIRFWWIDGDDPTAQVIEKDDDGRPTLAIVRIIVNRGWFFDPTPDQDEEFNMRPKLFRTLHPAEKNEALRVLLGTIPEVFEVAFSGKGNEADLMTAALHEVGHSIGLAGNVTKVANRGEGFPLCDPPDSVFIDLDSSLIDSSVIMGVKFAEGQEADGTPTGNFDCSHLALGGIKQCKNDPDQSVHSQEESNSFPGLTVEECTSHQSLFWGGGEFTEFRTRPGIADILSIARVNDWQQIDLPRKYSLASGQWTDAETWLGRRKPDGGDDVYIVNQLPLFEITEITVSANGVAKEVFLSDENRLRVQDATLDVGGTVTVAGPLTQAGPIRLKPPEEEPPNGEPPIGIEGPFSTLRVDADGVFKAFDVVVESGARFEMSTNVNGFARIGTMKSDGVISGFGTVHVSNLENTRIISAKDGVLTFVTPEADIVLEPPLLDLDGPNFTGDPLAAVRAMDGDLVFDGKLADPVQAAITVGAGRSITFVEGWEQGFSSAFFSPLHQLTLDGVGAEAVIHGGSTLGGRIEVNGLGAFTSPVIFVSTASLRLGIGGLTPGTEYDQIRFEQAVLFGGELVLGFTNGFSPGFGDTFTLATYASRTGEFATVTGVDLEQGIEGGLMLFLKYGATELTLEVGLQGGAPGAANCNGQTVSEQAKIHGSIKKAAKFHGFDSVQEFKDALKEFCEG